MLTKEPLPLSQKTSIVFKDHAQPSSSLWFKRVLKSFCASFYCFISFTAAIWMSYIMRNSINNGWFPKDLFSITLPQKSCQLTPLSASLTLIPLNCLLTSPWVPQHTPYNIWNAHVGISWIYSSNHMGCCLVKCLTVMVQFPFINRIRMSLFCSAPIRQIFHLWNLCPTASKFQTNVTLGKIRNKEIRLADWIH